MSIYDIEIKKMNGENVPMSAYQGKVLLIVNTATGCGFTPQYDELQDLYEECADQGLEILDFPCNQFANQAPGDDEEIHSFCTGRYGITFPQFAKIEVRGENAHPLYRYLTQAVGFEGFGKGVAALAMKAVAKGMDKDYKSNGSVKWNFTKFVVDRQGNVIKRFEPTEKMSVVKDYIKEVL